MFSYTVARIKDLNDTDDILQVVYTAFFRRMKSKGVPDEESALKLLYTSLKHELSRTYGYRKKELMSVSLDNEATYEQVEYELSQAYDSLENADRQLLEDIWSMIEARGDLTTRLFILHFKVGLTIAECAEKLEITPSNATSRLYRTIGDIKKKLKGSELT